MGCGASTQPVSDIPGTSTSNAEISVQSGAFTRIMNEKSPVIRLDQCDKAKVLKPKDKKSVKIRYSYISQRGYYPEALTKANQDSYLVLEGILGDDSCNLFGVFDGHGQYGDLCSHYAADQFSLALIEELKEYGGTSALDDPVKMNKLYTNAFVNANQSLHDSQIDDSLSGTTGITLLQKDNRLLVGNVGDSRAIIGSMIDGKIQYSPLSNDQTPYRKDERERIKKAGGRIMTIDQLEGHEPIHENFGTQLGKEIDEGGDPPRVWDQTLERPGCAFSRSIGDAVAKRCGVCAEPEILEWELRPEDKFAVVASDGVFEFITSQHVVEMVERFDNRLEAAKHIVAEAYRLWLTYDDRTDDITLIIIEFDHAKPVQHILSRGNSIINAGESMKMPTESAVKVAESVKLGGRPVRKVMSREKRKIISESWDRQESVDFDFTKVEDNKSEEVIARLSTMLASNFLFSNLSPIQKDNIYKVMKLREVSKGEVIIKEGDEGDLMYVVDSGEFSVRKVNSKGVEQVVFIYNTQGSAFGELSLMYGKPRAASVIAMKPGKLWSIGRAAFRAVMMRGKNEGLLEIYQTLPVVSKLSIPEIHRLCQGAIEKNFSKDELILSEDQLTSKSGDSKEDMEWVLAIVITGVIKLTPKEDQKKRQLRAELSYLSVMEIGTRFTEVRAESSKVKISCIPKELYLDIVGEKGEELLRTQSVKPKSKGKRLQPVKSIFNIEENLKLAKVTSKDSYELVSPILTLGDFGYIGNFTWKGKADENPTNSIQATDSFGDTPDITTNSIKVIIKERAGENGKMDSFLLNERRILAQIYNSKDTSGTNIPSDLYKKYEAWLPVVCGIYKDETQIYLIYMDQYRCDLSLALSSNAIPPDAISFYIAGIYQAIATLHQFGIQHRFVNSGSIYITSTGRPKLADFRYAKQMDGARSYTICGDPLYFAPEIVSQQGYDYSADLWAFGIICFEFFEGSYPIGSSEMEEHELFQNILSFNNVRLKFTKKTPDGARQMIRNLLNPVGDRRLGYKNPGVIPSMEIFNGLNWSQLEQEKGFPLDIQNSFDLENFLSEGKTGNYSSPDFDEF